jgi:hypothetical protein
MSQDEPSTCSAIASLSRSGNVAESTGAQTQAALRMVDTEDRGRR